MFIMDLQMYHTFLLHLVLVFVCSWNNAVDGCEVACFPPSNTPPAHSTSEEMAVAEGRCYTACLERVSSCLNELNKCTTLLAKYYKQLVFVKIFMCSIVRSIYHSAVIYEFFFFFYMTFLTLLSSVSGLHSAIGEWSSKESIAHLGLCINTLHTCYHSTQYSYYNIL